MVVMKGEVGQLLEGRYKAMRPFRARSPTGRTAGRPSTSISSWKRRGERRPGRRRGRRGRRVYCRRAPIIWLRRRQKRAGGHSGPTFRCPDGRTRKIRDLNDVQFTELQPGANSRSSAARGQLSFLRMDPA